MKAFFRNNKKKILKLLAVIAIVMIAATIWYEVPVTEYIAISGEGKIDSTVRFALITDLHSCYYGKDQSQLIKMIDKEKPDAILLSHRPEKVKAYEKYDFDLILCGHAHGGQWRIPFTKRGVAAPNQGLLPAYVDGLYDLDNGAEMIVSRGLARERMPYPRFFNHPEVVIIDIG